MGLGLGGFWPVRCARAGPGFVGLGDAWAWVAGLRPPVPFMYLFCVRALRSMGVLCPAAPSLVLLGLAGPGSAGLGWGWLGLPGRSLGVGILPAWRLGLPSG